MSPKTRSATRKETAPNTVVSTTAKRAPSSRTRAARRPRLQPSRRLRLPSSQITRPELFLIVCLIGNPSRITNLLAASKKALPIYVEEMRSRNEWPYAKDQTDTMLRNFVKQTKLLRLLVSLRPFFASTRKLALILAEVEKWDELPSGQLKKIEYDQHDEDFVEKNVPEEWKEGVLEVLRHPMVGEAALL